MTKRKLSYRSQIPMIVLWALLIAYGFSCLYLYYMQSIQPLDYDNRFFQSDLPYHLSMILDDGWYYSFTAYVYHFLNLLTPGRTELIALFLASVTVLTVILTERLLRLLLEKERISPLSLVGALILNFVMAFFLEPAGSYRYVSYQAGNLWHNSTYLCMKLGAIAALLLYFKIEKNYRAKISPGDWISFSLTLVLTTGIKPSFLTVFAPAMALKLLWDLFHKVSFKQIVLFGSAVLPACGVILWQNAILFGESTEQGFSFHPWYTFSLHADRPKLAVLCSIAFPLVVLCFSLKDLWKDKKYFFAWLMTGIGFLEALLLAETGSRSRDGNFLWGYCFAIFYIFLCSFPKWLKLWKKEGHPWCYKAMYVFAGLVLCYQLYCGLYFFLCLLNGETYFMYG